MLYICTNRAGFLFSDCVVFHSIVWMYRNLSNKFSIDCHLCCLWSFLVNEQCLNEYLCIYIFLHGYNYICRINPKNGISRLCWVTTLWVSHVSTCLVSRGTHGFCFRLSFQRYLHSKQPWETEIVSPSGAKARLFTVQCGKDSVSSSGAMVRWFYCLF